MINECKLEAEREKERGRRIFCVCEGQARISAHHITNWSSYERERERERERV